MNHIPAPDNSSSDDSDNGFLLPRSANAGPRPLGDANVAADVIRDKLTKLYAAEPDALTEEKEAEVARPRSKHQQFMYELNHSGKDLAQIQTEWHNYYVNLPDDEKRQVWQEFYESNQRPQIVEQPDAVSDTEKLAAIKNQITERRPVRKAVVAGPANHEETADEREPTQIRQSVRRTVRGRQKLTRKQHVQSIAFGLGIGLLAVFIFLFGFFNEVLIAPFIQPSRTTQATPLIVTADSIAPTSTPEVIIPKINVQVPVDFNETSTDESTIENDLKSGVVHYPTTALPGQTGNVAFFGHSSNNIFNSGSYKFVFVLLHTLVPGDTFYITYHGKVYAYKVFSKTIVDPSDVGVLDPVQGHSATATLITCDPPGTSLHRLIIVGDQISPDPSTDTAASTASANASDSTTELAGNGQTLWGKFISQGYGKAIVGIVIALAVIYFFRRAAKKQST